MEDFWTKGTKFLEQHPEYLEDFRNRIALKVYVPGDNDKIVQMVHTPKQLCKQITTKLKEHVDIRGKKILVLNIEFIPYLLDAEELVILCDNDKKVEFVNRLYPDVAFPQIEVWEGCLLDYGELEMEFDVICMNPPYQGNHAGDGEGRNKLLWPSFVERGLEITANDGYLCLVHPSLWRKPEHKIWDLLTKNNMEFLSIHSDQEGDKIFGATTRFDWYICQKASNRGKCLVRDQSKYETKLDLQKLSFLPNWNLQKFLKIMTEKNGVDVIYGTAHHNQSEHVRKIKSDEFCYPVIHSITAKGPVTYWTKNKTVGSFGRKKVIVNTGRILYAINDFNGSCGMTEGCFGIPVTSESEASKIVSAITSEKFQNDIIKPSKWSNFRIDYRMFKYFRKDFWKDFI